MSPVHFEANEIFFFWGDGGGGSPLLVGHNIFKGMGGEATSSNVKLSLRGTGVDRNSGRLAGGSAYT